MYIDEIPTGSVISITIKDDRKTRTMFTKVMGVSSTKKEHYIEIPKAVTEEDQIVSLSFTDDKQHARFVWKDIDVNALTSKVLVLSPKQAKRYDRRSEPRVKLGIPCAVECPTLHVTSGVLNDLSIHGFSVQLGEMQIPSLKEELTISFEDETFSNVFNGVVLHVEIMEDKSVRCGGIIVDTLNSMDSYIDSVASIQLEKTLEEIGSK